MPDAPPHAPSDAHRDAAVFAVNSRLAAARDEAFLRTLVDLAWGEALGDNSLAPSRTQIRLIARARAAMEAAHAR